MDPPSPNGARGGAGGAGDAVGLQKEYSLSQFKFVKDLGNGAFGIVQQVVNIESGELFAMKVLEKRKVIERQLQEQLKREVLTQLRAHHPNVVRMHYYFEDEKKVYCLLEYADRGQLFAHLRERHCLTEREAAKFLEESASGLAYLHGLGVIHRDIKPENILLFGEDMCAKLGDLGWCVELTQERPDRQTFCGTMDYIAPEMLLNEPHDAAVDLWALGVLLYEMLLARAPFTARSQKEAMDLICAAKANVPPGAISAGAVELIEALLRREKKSRLPADQVLRHPWVVSRGGSLPTRGECNGTVDSLLETKAARPAPAPAGRGGAAEPPRPDSRDVLTDATKRVVERLRLPESKDSDSLTEATRVVERRRPAPSADSLADGATKVVERRPAPQPRIEAADAGAGPEGRGAPGRPADSLARMEEAQVGSMSQSLEGRPGPRGQSRDPAPGGRGGAGGPAAVEAWSDMDDTVKAGEPRRRVRGEDAQAEVREVEVEDSDWPRVEDSDLLGEVEDSRVRLEDMDRSYRMDMAAERERRMRRGSREDLAGHPSAPSRFPPARQPRGRQEEEAEGARPDLAGPYRSSCLGRGGAPPDTGQALAPPAAAPGIMCFPGPRKWRNPGAEDEAEDVDRSAGEVILDFVQGLFFSPPPEPARPKR